MGERPIDFNVEAIDDVTLTATGQLAERDLMSPFVWRHEDGTLGILVRAVPKVVDPHGDTGVIYYGVSKDGLTFDMDAVPVLSPGPGRLDVGGCEDPTLVIYRKRYFVYYTGVDESRASGQLCYASGDDVRSLKKRGVALASSKTQGNTKEPTINRTVDGRWRLFYEYARDDASLVGLSLGRGVAGPWHERPAPFSPRPDAWDSWHLSTGPMLTDDPEKPVMLYNGATQDARWRVGWVAFDRDCTKVIDRCIEPLLVPPPPSKRAETDIAFAASVIQQQPGISHLYYSLEDRMLKRAVIRRAGWD